MKKTSFWLQCICFLLIFLSCLTIGFGSWLETNDLFYLSSPMTSQRFSIFKITMVADAKTLYLSVGLWRYCISDTINNINECSPIRMNFNIDAFTLMDSIIYTNLSQLPTLTSVSYVRLIPLLLSSFIGVVSACISLYLLPGNHKKSVQRKGLLWLTSILCFTSAGLVSATIGVTYSQYSRNIRNACHLVLSKHDINNIFICQSYTPNLEIILFGLAIGFFTISSIYCMFISSQSQNLADSCKTHNTDMSSFSFYDSEEDYRSPVPSTLDIEEKQRADETVWNNNNKERLSLRPPPPFTNNVRVGCRSTTDSPLKVHQARYGNKPDSVTDINYVQPNMDIKLTSSSTEDVLLPPTLPFANNSNNRSSYNSRPLSHGSGNTFGAFSSDPNSPSADDASQASSSSYVDHQRSDSTGTYNTSYTTHGTQSNHTLGTFPKPSSHAYLYYNSSFEDEDTRSFHNNSSENNTITNSSAVSNQSSIIPEQSSSNVLSKRIHDYLQQN